MNTSGFFDIDDDQFDQVIDHSDRSVDMVNSTHGVVVSVVVSVFHGIHRFTFICSRNSRSIETLTFWLKNINVGYVGTFFKRYATMLVHFEVVICRFVVMMILTKFINFSVSGPSNEVS